MLQIYEKGGPRLGSRFAPHDWILKLADQSSLVPYRLPHGCYFNPLFGTIYDEKAFEKNRVRFEERARLSASSVPVQKRGGVLKEPKPASLNYCPYCKTKTEDYLAHLTSSFHLAMVQTCRNYMETKNLVDTLHKEFSAKNKSTSAVKKSLTGRPATPAKRLLTIPSHTPSSGAKQTGPGQERGITPFKLNRNLARSVERSPKLAELAGKRENSRTKKSEISMFGETNRKIGMLRLALTGEGSLRNNLHSLGKILAVEMAFKELQENLKSTADSFIGFQESLYDIRMRSLKRKGKGELTDLITWLD
jgi:hypothetical protein